MKKNKSKKKPNRCPQCGHDKLIHFELDTFCSRCDWDTCAAYVAQGMMDNIYKAHAEHFGLCIDAPKVNQETTKESELKTNKSA